MHSTRYGRQRFRVTGLGRCVRKLAAPWCRPAHKCQRGAAPLSCGGRRSSVAFGAVISSGHAAACRARLRNASQSRQRLEVFPGGPPPQYSPGRAPLKFGGGKRSGVFDAVWPPAAASARRAWNGNGNSAQCWTRNCACGCGQLGAKHAVIVALRCSWLASRESRASSAAQVLRSRRKLRAHVDCCRRVQRRAEFAGAGRRPCAERRCSAQNLAAP